MSRNQVIAVVVLAGTVVAALGALLDLPQKIEVLYRRIRPKSDIVQFQSLDQQALLRFGASFSYPQGWDRLNAPENSGGSTFVDPDDKNVRITGYGSFSPSVLGDGSLAFAIEWERQAILALRDGKIAEEAESGTYVKNAKGERWDIDGWRAIYYYIDEEGRRMAALEKLAVADGREVVLVMRAPAKVFPRYKSAFLQLSADLHLTPPQDYLK
jgi:hypothetical protein